MGEHVEKSWDLFLPDILFAPHVRLPHDCGGRQMLGHSSTQIVPRYAQVLDQNRLDATKKLELLRASAISDDIGSQSAQSEPEDRPTRH